MRDDGWVQPDGKYGEDAPSMRISDADRDWAASVLNDAVAQGRLTADEHSERLDAVYAAKTSADIAPLIKDLPGGVAGSSDALSLRPQAAQLTAASAPARMVFFFSGTEKKGVWQVPAEIRTVSVFGGASFDLREAKLPPEKIKIRAVCVFGGLEIKIPPDMQVVDSGFSIFGGKDVPPAIERPASSSTPVLYLHGICVFGGISVSRKRKKSAAGKAVGRLDR
jgi:DUF1707 SHOCT-like domain